MSYSPTSLPQTPDWRDLAECRRADRNIDPELFHPVGETGPWIAQIEEAQAVCRSCPVMEQCAQWALDNHESGIWGGMTDQDRTNWRRRIQRANAANEPEKVRQPIIVYPSHEHAYRVNTLTDGDHLVWVGGNEVKVDGRRYSPNQTAWWATHGAAPVGRVFTDCDHDGCVLHLNDQAVRTARKAEQSAAA